MGMASLGTQPTAGPTDRLGRVRKEIDALVSEATNFGARFIQDDQVRSGYVAEAKEMAQEVLAKAEAGVLTPEQAYKEAQALRNGIMDAARIKSSDIGSAVAYAEKAAGKSIPELEAKYAQQIFKRAFDNLTAAERDTVFLEIVRASGRPNPEWTLWATRLGRTGKAFILVSAAFVVYDVATSDNKVRTAEKDGASLASGFLGSIAGGAAAGLACGPGAPICVAVGAFVGGALFAYTSDVTFDWLNP